MNKKQILTPISVVLFLVFAWICFLTQNLPFSTMDDPTLVYLAKNTSFQKILSRILNPLTPTWTYQFQAMGAEQNSLGLRPVELLLWKILLSVFGDAASPFFIMKALFLSLVSGLIFYFTYQMTKNRWAGALAALFYATTLSAFGSIIFISDFGLLAQFIQGLLILVFLNYLHKNETGSWDSKSALVGCALLFGLAWAGIKCYETVKILPPCLLFFIFLVNWRHLPGFLKNKNNNLLLFTLLAMFILVVPIAKSFYAYRATGAIVKNQVGLQYHWDTLYRFVLQNTRNAWEAEKDIAFFSLKHTLPFSLTRSLGFFLAWAFLFSLIFFLAQLKSLTSFLDQKQKRFLGFTALWTFVDLAALGLAKESDGRHLMAPLIPFSIFAGSLLFYVTKALSGKFQKAFLTFCLAGWVFAFFTNISHDIYFRKFIGGITIAQAKYMPFIYKDYYGAADCSYEDLIRFMRVPEALCIWYIPFIADDQYGSFIERIRPENLEKIYRRYGHAYVVTIDPSLVPRDKRYLKLGEFNEINQSLFSDWVLRFKKKKGGTHTVYQFKP